jgi:hypothetical protein
MGYDLAPQTVFPDYQLPDHTGIPRRLSELQDDDPLIRPDWDLGTPKLRDAWRAGDFAAFYGWNKSVKAV